MSFDLEELDEDEYFDDLFEELFPDGDLEPSFADQPWQGDESLRALV